MRRHCLVLLICLVSNFGNAQKTWNIKAIADEMSHEEFTAYLATVTSCDRIRKLAKSCMVNDEYNKAIKAYNKIIQQYRKNLTVMDVSNFYICLLKIGRIDQIPYPGLEVFDHELSSLLSIVKIQQGIAKDNNGTELEKLMGVEYEEFIAFGFSVKDSNNFHMYNQEEDKLLTYRLTDNYLIRERKVNTDLKKKYKLLTLCQSHKDTYLYSVYDEELGLYRIKIEGDSLPPFNRSSRLASCAMPWFDKCSQRLYYSTIDSKGYGGWDIVFSNLENGKWGKPEFLDEQVNTQLDEIFPSVVDDILFYSSDGRIGMGKLDNYAFDMVDKVNYNLIESNSPQDDYCIRVINATMDFYTCRNTEILKGRLDDFLTFAVAEEKIDSVLAANNVIDEVNIAESERMDNMFSDVVDELEQTSYTFAPTYIDNDDVRESFNDYVEEESTGQLKHEEEMPDTYNYLKQYIQEIKTTNDGQSILVFGATHTSSNKSFNYFLSINSARYAITYLKKEIINKVNFIPVVCGDRHSSTILNSQKDELQNGYCKVCNLKLPYELMIVVSLNEYGSIVNIADSFNNKESEIKILQELLEPALRTNYCLVGIQSLHRVGLNETLNDLAVRFNCKMKDLRNVNGKLNDSINTGDLLIIPLEDQ